MSAASPGAITGNTAIPMIDATRAIIVAATTAAKAERGISEDCGEGGTLFVWWEGAADAAVIIGPQHAFPAGRLRQR